MASQTKQVSIRLSTETMRQIKDLQRQWGENRSQVIIRCIERMWTQNNSKPRQGKGEFASDLKP